MDVFLYSIWVLLVTILVLYLPILVVGLVHLLYQEFLSKKKVYGYIFCFIFCYLFVSFLGVGLYYLISDFEGAKSSTPNRTDVIYIFTAVATIFAPLILVFTLNSWKKQKIEESKIKAIGKIKGLLSMQFNITNKFLINNSMDSFLTEGDLKVIKETDEWVKSFDEIRWRILGVIQKNYYYLNSNKEELDEIFRLFNETLNFSLAIDNALSQIRFGLRKVEEENNESIDYIRIKRIYLIHPYSSNLKWHLNGNTNLKISLDKYAKDKSFGILENFDNYLNTILDKTYDK